MHDTLSPPCARWAAFQFFLLFSALKVPWSSPKVMCRDCRTPGLPALHIGVHSPRNNKVCRSQGCRTKARELASAETLALARPISSQTSIAHPTNNQKHVCNHPAPRILLLSQLSPFAVFVMVAIAATRCRSDTSTSNPPCRTNTKTQTRHARTVRTGHPATS